MKITRVLLIIAIVCLGVSAAFAALNSTYTAITFNAPATAGGAATNLSFTASTNVTVGINSGNAAYAANSKHLNGNRTFGTASDATQIFWSEAIAVGTVLTGAPSASGASAFSSWHSL